MEIGISIVRKLNLGSKSAMHGFLYQFEATK
jgi:hypothetical protein